MGVVTGVFKTRAEAERVVDSLRELGVAESQIGYLTPGKNERAIERDLPYTDSEGPGMGKAMGATVGGAVGAAGGAALGAAVASLAVPGVGPVMAIGLLGAALLGTTGAVTGGLAGGALEESLGEGTPHEQLYLYEEGLRRGYSVVVATTADSTQEGRAVEAMRTNGAIDPNELRESWWSNIRTGEQSHYQDEGRDFESDEVSYRRGFEAALHAKRRGRSYDEAENDLRSAYGDAELNTAFRRGYERGLRYQTSVVELHKA